MSEVTTGLGWCPFVRRWGECTEKGENMHSLLDIELAAAIDRDRRQMRLGPSLRELVHRGHSG